MLFFAAFFDAVASAVGAATGHRGLAVGAGAAVGVFGFAADGIMPQVDGLEWIEDWSPVPLAQRIGSAEELHRAACS